MTIKNLQVKMKYTRELELLIIWKPQAKAQLGKIENPEYNKVSLIENDGMMDNHTGNTTIYDCL
jgi:hypothetical protein